MSQKKEDIEQKIEDLEGQRQQAVRNLGQIEGAIQALKQQITEIDQEAEQDKQKKSNSSKKSKNSK